MIFLTARWENISTVHGHAPYNTCIVSQYSLHANEEKARKVKLFTAPLTLVLSVWQRIIRRLKQRLTKLSASLAVFLVVFSSVNEMCSSFVRAIFRREQLPSRLPQSLRCHESFTCLSNIL